MPISIEARQKNFGWAVVTSASIFQLSEQQAEKCNPISLLANLLNNAAWLVTNQASDIDEIEKAAKAVAKEGSKKK